MATTSRVMSRPAGLPAVGDPMRPVDGNKVCGANLIAGNQAHSVDQIDGARNVSPRQPNAFGERAFVVGRQRRDFGLREVDKIRPERHIPNSIATMRRRLIIALTRRLSRCRMSQPGPSGWILPLVPFHFTLVQNIKRDPFEQAVGIDQKSAMSLGGALGAPMTAFQYDWNMLPIGQQLWMEHLLSYEKYPPLQAPETYNLSGILEQVKKANASGASD